MHDRSFVGVPLGGDDEDQRVAGRPPRRWKSDGADVLQSGRWIWRWRKGRGGAQQVEMA